jgi:hypothetical protein
MGRIFVRSFAMVVGCAVAFAAMGGNTVGASTTVGDHKVVGAYTWHVDWDGYPPSTFPLRLRRDQTGHDGEHQDHLTWSTSSHAITIEVTNTPAGSNASFVGVVTAAGLNTDAEPGTMSNNHGLTGTWYAIKTG